MIKHHINGNHWGLTDYEIVSREGELTIVSEVLEDDIEIPVEKPVFEVPEEPEVVVYPINVDVSLGGISAD